MPIVQPGAPGEPGRVISARQAADLSQLRYTAAEVRFMQGMIGHHLQALEMTALLATRTAHEGMRLLAKRIEISQADEIQMMRDWLKARGEALPDPHAHHAPGADVDAWHADRRRRCSALPRPRARNSIGCSSSS